MSGWDRSIAAQPRWAWLHAALAEAGITCTVERNNGPKGAEFITLNLGSGDHVCVHDLFFRDRWAGWTVFQEGRDGFAVTIIDKTKDQAQVVAAMTKVWGARRAQSA